eukprot:CAMPEP_0181318862 /NCGR_PEP_ID=MMETSP1101-20121128/17238_1 /TAXON_ID=46948 /ORGANISM="Rhodomonas abbreviata, Strain Caron Lab Isolate" /LENGTH=358 /DNA_ID=CAMNT_0023426371 /DNA_START=23 /DNA_END=1099 /DNA_ORIENTATION=+
MAWDDDEEDDWESKDEVDLAPKPKAAAEKEWSDEEEEEEEDEDQEARYKKLREEKAELLKRVAEIEEIVPMEQPKESAKKGKQQKKMLKEREEEDRRRAEEALAADKQVSLQRKVEESDFENAQDMFGTGKSGQEGGGDSGKFESWPLNSQTKQAEVEEFALYTGAKVVQFKDEFLYLALVRKLVQEIVKGMEVDKVKELMLVFTKGREDFTVVDLVRWLLRDVDQSMSPEEVLAAFGTAAPETAKKGPKGKVKEVAKLTPRQELIKVLLHDMVKELKSEDAGRIIEEGCGVVLTNDQTKKIAAKRAELTNDPNANKAKGSARVADHKSMAMYDAFGTGGGEDWGGGGGTRGDDVDFM